MNDWNEAERCQHPDCRAYHGQHAINCPIAPPDYVKQQRDQYYNAWLTETKEKNAAWKRFKADVEKWQSKCAVLKHENNVLRRKLVAANRRMNESNKPS